MEILKLNLERFKKLREEMPDLFADMVNYARAEYNNERMIVKYGLTHDAARVKLIDKYFGEVEQYVAGKLSFEKLSDIVCESYKWNMESMTRNEVKTTDEYRSIIRKVDESISKKGKVIDLVKNMNLSENELMSIGAEIMGMSSEIRFERMKQERDAKEKQEN